MRQRNPGPHALTVPTIPAEVQPGEIVDWPEPICGFEAVDDNPAPAEPATDIPVDSGKKPAKTTSKAASPAADDKEATQ